ncbi:MAG: hypothetical protein IJ514_01725 [Clostridia bacterium]|nr:hypothetical protein [Clostridia bacterium]
MRGKNVLIIILTVIVFLSAAVLGVSTVYRVSEVTVNAPVVSEEAKSEAESLQKRLEEAYARSSTFFVDQTLADEIVADFPYFRITSFTRAYPNRIVVEVTEDAEVYAASFGEGGYYILGADGTVLGIRDDYANRTDGEPNILLFGTPSLNVVGDKGKPLSSDAVLTHLFAFCNKANEIFLAGKIGQTGEAPRGIRGNVVSVEVLRPVEAESETMFRLSMAEGVSIYVRNPSLHTLEKAEKAVDAYSSLSDRQKLTGALLVLDGETGITTAYYENFQF